jgi:WD40 repeat protein
MKRALLLIATFVCFLLACALAMILVVSWKRDVSPLQPIPGPGAQFIPEDEPVPRNGHPNEPMMGSVWARAGCQLTGLCFSPDSRSVYLSDSAGALRRWGVPELRQLSEAVTDQLPIDCLSAVPNGEAVIGGLGNGKVREWRIPSLEFLEDITLGPNQLYEIRVCPINRQIVTEDVDATIQFWSSGKNYRLLKTIDLDLPRAHVAVSKDGELVALGVADGAGNSIWKTTTWEGAPLGKRSSDGQGSRPEWRGVAFLGSTHILAFGGSDPWIGLWDCDQGCEVGRLALDIYPLGLRISTLAASADGKLVAAGVQGDLHLWDVVARKRIASWWARDAGTRLLDFAPDSSVLACVYLDIGGDDQPGHSEAVFWDVAKLRAGKWGKNWREKGEFRVPIKTPSPIEARTAKPANRKR